MKKPASKSKFAPPVGGDSTLAHSFGGPLRPWSSTGVRLALKLGAAVGPKKEWQNNMGLGWVLTRLGLAPIKEGEAAVEAVARPAPAPLNAAEYRTLREDCGLSLREAAAWHNVAERTVSYWESGGPKPEVAQELLALRAQMQAAAVLAVEVAQQQISAHPEIMGQPIELVRYTAADYPLTQPAKEGLPHGAHNRLLSLTADALAQAGIGAVIEYRGAGRMYPGEADGEGPDLPPFIGG